LIRDIAYTGDGIALVWSDYCDSFDKCDMFYALWGMDGRVVVSPRPVASSLDHISIGSSGTTVFVFEGGGYIETPPMVLLLDMGGNLLDGPMPAASGYSCFWGALGVFWEGDAYALLWNTWPNEYIFYRRFRVEE